MTDAFVVETRAELMTLSDVPEDMLLHVLEALGPQSFRDVAPVCQLFCSLAADKLAEWRARKTLSTKITFTELGETERRSCWPMRTLTESYEPHGVRLSGSAVGVVPGVTGGDPGGWQLEGTVRNVAGGGRFVGLNEDGQQLTMRFRSPVAGVTFDAVTRDADVTVQVTATSASGKLLHDQHLVIGPERSTWITEASCGHRVEAFRARAIDTTHVTTFSLSLTDPGEGEEERTPEGHAAVGVCIGGADEIASVTFTLHDQVRLKEDGRAVGLANLRVFV